MKHYNLHVRDMLDWTERELWDLERPATATLTFDDKEVIEKTDTVDIIVSWYYWQIASRYRELSVTRELFLDGKVLTDDVHRELTYIAISATMGKDINREDVWYIAYSEIYNKLYNALATRLLPYISSTDVPDIIELLFDDEIHAANIRVTNNPRSVDRSYAAFKRVLASGKYPSNPIVRAVRNKTVPMNQMLQSFCPRGRVTDIDSVIFKRPITRGFAQGFRSINDWAKESRSAAKALLFNKDPVADAEYFNRKLQLVTSVLTHITVDDCGTQDAHEFVIPAIRENAKCEGRELVDCLAGLYQVLDSNTVREIRKGDYHLCGTTIRFRTTMCCKLLPQQHVCKTCYGQTAYAVPHDTNPGHVSCTSINKRITQLIISTKHLDFIEYKFAAILRGNESYYMAVREKSPESIFLSSKKKDRSITLRIKSKEAEKLVDINYLSHLSNTSPGGISSLSEVQFFELDKNGVFIVRNDIEPNFDLTKMATKPSLSLEMLTYLKVKGWTPTRSGDYYDIQIDSDWDINDPLFTYPHKHDNMSEYGYRVERFIRSSNNVGPDDDTRKRDISNRPAVRRQVMLNRYSDPTEALYDAWYLINEKLSGVHIGHIATVAAVTRISDRTTGNWHMPGGLMQGNFASHDDLIANRDLSVAMLYEKQSDVFDKLPSYLNKDRPISIMQDLIHIPREKALIYANNRGRLK